jgi:hypothetical protein
MGTANTSPPRRKRGATGSDATCWDAVLSIERVEPGVGCGSAMHEGNDHVGRILKHTHSL